MEEVALEVSLSVAGSGEELEGTFASGFCTSGRGESWEFEDDCWCCSCALAETTAGEVDSFVDAEGTVDEGGGAGKGLPAEVDAVTRLS